MSRQRLAVIVEGMHAFGGTERQAVDIACGMSARNYDVTLLSRWPIDREHALLPELADHEVRVIPRGWTGAGTGPLQRPHVVASRLVSLGRPSALAKHSWRWEASQLHKVGGATIAHEVPIRGYVAPSGQLVHDRLRIPVVQTILGTLSTPVHAIAPWVVVTSDCSPAMLPADQPVMWIPTMGPAGEPRSARAMPADGHWRIAFAGRLVEPKGASLLIRAFASLGANAELTVMGDGEEMASLVALASRLGVAVTFPGRLDRRAVLTELERSHVLVVPSLDEEFGEGIPTVIGEALWAGLPVIATSVGGVQRLFDDARPGWLVAAGDEDALAQALAEAMTTAHSRAAQAALATYDRLLCPRAVLDRYEEAYELAKRAPRQQRTARRRR